jgi:Ca-activated chloride channel family protein
MRAVFALLLAGLLSRPAPVAACDLALLLAVDVSGSVDEDDWRIQRDGLAAALRDGLVAEALVRAEAQVALMQWTGTGRQRVTMPWTRIADFAAADALAERVAREARIWRNFSTAVGEALEVGLSEMAQVRACRRKVIDVSGDGRSNEGVPPAEIRSRLAAAGITVNALVIEGDEPDLTAWYWENVITGEGAFVVTANGFEEYPERIRQKLIRETVRQISELDASP